MPPDQTDNQHPKLSIITASLNQGRFLRQMVESVLAQTYQNYEHIVMDGGSTDNSIEILKEYPHIKWVCEKDNSASEAFAKLRSMIKGDYVIQCCSSDGFLDKRWFQICVDILDKNKDISMVWGLPQYMTEDGFMQHITTPEYLFNPPPQKKDFLGFWLATGHVLYEGNQCTRSDVFKRCVPSGGKLKENIFLHLIYNFMTGGYLPYFVPVIANFGRIHHDACGQSKIIQARMDVSVQEYLADIKKYKKDLFSHKIKHFFRSGDSQIISEFSKADLNKCKAEYLKAKIDKLTSYSFNVLLRGLIRRLKGQKHKPCAYMLEDQWKYLTQK